MSILTNSASVSIVVAACVKALNLDNPKPDSLWINSVSEIKEKHLLLILKRSLLKRTKI